jgi:hypothetical protein
MRMALSLLVSVLQLLLLLLLFLLANVLASDSDKERVRDTDSSWSNPCAKKHASAGGKERCANDAVGTTVN